MKISARTAANQLVASGGFHVQNGQITAPDGQPFVCRGMAVLDAEMSYTPAATIISQFPGINCVSLAVGADNDGYASAQPNSAIISWVNDATSRGLVVMLSDYVPGQPQVRSGSDLAASLNWYSSMAQTFANNPYVWWTTENEVSGNLSTMEQDVYNAIRGAGNNGLIFMEAQDGDPMTTNGLNASIFANMTGVGFNIHIYPWEFDTSQGSQSYYNNTIKKYVSIWQSFAQSQDGLMPVLMGEGGNSTSGNGLTPDDPIINGNFAVTKGITDTAGVSGGTIGYFIWLHDWFNGPGDADTLVDGNGNLTDYGSQVAAAIAAGGSTPLPPPPSNCTESANDTIVNSVGPTICDGSGNSYAINSNGQITMNGSVMQYTASVVELAYVNHVLWQENSSQLWWAWSNGSWSPTDGTSTSPLPANPPKPPATSADGTTVPPASQIVDAQGNVWTLVNSGGSLGNQIALNGTIDQTTKNVTLLLYYNNTFYQENSADNWYRWNGNGWSQDAGDPRPAAPAQVVLTRTSGGSIIDHSGNVWTLDSQGNVIENGNPVPDGSGTAELTYVSSTDTIWGQDASTGNWYSWNGSNWVGPSSTSPITSPSPSPSPTPEYPDLVVTSISMSPANPVAGDAVTFSAVVKNQGKAATPAGTLIGVGFSIDGTGVSWSASDSASLQPGASVKLTANGGPNSSTWTAMVGSHSLTAYVDDVNRITESNENNNQRTKSISVTQVVLTRTSGGSITDNAGNVWTLTSSGVIKKNGSPVPGGSGTEALTYVSSTDTIWGQDASSENWYFWDGSNWNGPSSTNPVQ